MSPVSPAQFFEALYEGVEAGFIEIRPLLDPSDPDYKKPEGGKIEWGFRKFFSIRKDGIKKAADYCLAIGGREAVAPRVHTYFGVGLRKDRKGGGKENVGSVTTAFTDIDFKHIPKEKVIENLKNLKFKPSIIVMSGNGVHVYWLLKEPLYQGSFPDLEGVNVGLLNHCGAQVGVQDVSRILRVPETVNLKSVYPDPKPFAQVVRFEPDRRHDFEELKDFFKSTLPSKKKIEQQSLALPSSPEVLPQSFEPVDVSSLPISDFTKRIIREGLPAYIEYRKSTDRPDRFEVRVKKGHLSRSEADSHVILQLLNAGLSDLQIYSIYRDPSNRVGEKYRERRDGDKYLGITIRSSKEFRAEHPRVSPNDAAERIGKRINRKFPDALLEITTITKIDYQSPIYLVNTRLLETDETVTTRCTEDELDAFKKFRKRFLVQNNRFPPFLTQQDWEGLVNSSKFEIQEVDKELATIEGEIDAALDDWLSQSQSEVSEAALGFLPVYDQETNEVYIRLKAFMQYLSNEKIDAKKRDVLQVVKRKGFHLEVKRFGKAVSKVWARSNQNGHPKQEGTLF